MAQLQTANTDSLQSSGEVCKLGGRVCQDKGLGLEQ